MSNYMSDYRTTNLDFHNPDDPFRNDPKLDPNVRAASAMWGWIAAAVFVAIVLVLALGAGHKPAHLGTNMAANTMAPPAATRMAPTTVLPPSATPAPAVTAPPPIAPAPNTPTQH